MTNIVLYLVLLIISKSSQGLGETCSKTSDCSTLKALCIDSVCTCDDLSYMNKETTQCLPYATEYNDFCYEDDQCVWLGDNSKCIRNGCVCEEGFRWYKGKCQKYADKGGKCASNDECYNGYDLLALSCSSNGVCECSDEYYDRGSDCRKKSRLGSDCAIQLDCQSSSLNCNFGSCSDKSETSYESVDEQPTIQTRSKILKHGEEDIYCNIDDDCGDMANSLCDVSNNTCGCDERYYYYYNKNCVKGLSHCDSDSDCSSVNNAVCFKSSCICQPGFFWKNENCIAELGVEDPHATYTKDGDCPIKPGMLKDSVCYCKNYWFNDNLNRNCIKTMIQSTNSCLTNEWCAAMGPYSFCDSTTSKCQCSSIAEFNENTYYCDLNSNSIDICLRDSDCNINERCLDEKCECVEDFSRSNDNTCVPNVGGSCKIAPCSHILNSHCAGKICTCDPNYTGKETKCLKMADHLEQPCEEQVQCENIKYSVCGVSENEYVTPEDTETLRCVCDADYVDVNKTCLQNKIYGDPCMTEYECTAVLNRSYKCRNSICQCAVGKSLKNAYCTSRGNVILATSFVWFAVVVKLFFVK